MSTSTRFNLNVFARVLKKRHPGKPHLTFFFSSIKLVRLFILKDVKPSLDSRMKELLTFDNSFSRHYDTLAKTRSRMTTSIVFSRKNDAGSLVSTTLY